MSVLDDLLLGDPARRLAFGLVLLVASSALLVWVEARVRRHGETYLDHRAALAVGAAVAPIGVAVAVSAPWGLLGVGVFVAVAIVVCAAGAVVMVLRGAI